MTAMHIIENIKKNLKEILTHTESGIVCEKVSGNLGRHTESDSDDMYQNCLLTFKVDGVEIVFHLVCEDHDTNESELTTEIIVKENKKTIRLRPYEGLWFYNGSTTNVRGLLCKARYIFGTHYESVAKCVALMAQNYESLGFR